ncbi:uncharacterized protein DSM5745_04741 [Aspergillus mulundensis]|uniref:Geranylgeranyl pyrophosphate synthetase n=1 Tax=Aspergillus mulundensis TaxID=1810919 RepID=A0A3D8S594_9EURO|nr:hypothetical protein DSM5745_04741 [Aspergillus mulundensis]RDW81184.1 hypothetical protein DSM5745_04741 [Aspergillus mulundensis]
MRYNTPARRVLAEFYPPKRTISQSPASITEVTHPPEGSISDSPVSITEATHISGSPVSVTEVTHPPKGSTSGSPVSITEVTHISSYNWIDASFPTIAVPGSPALWTPPKEPTLKVRKDVGRYFISQNTARYPKSPLEPLFRALYLEHPTFDIRSIDLVSDRGTLRRLLAFINPSLEIGKQKKSFRILVEVKKNTALFQYHDERIIQHVRPDDFQGYGREFEKAFTTELVQRSTGHHGIVSYRLGGLKLMVRHELDGYTSSSHEPTHLFPVDVPDRVENTSALTVRKAGHTVPRESTLEIKTCRAKQRGTYRISKILPQLWFSQTPKLVRASYRTEGLFTVPEVEDVTARMKEWEERHNADLHRFVMLLKDIIAAVKENGNKATVHYDYKRKS